MHARAFKRWTFGVAIIAAVTLLGGCATDRQVINQANDVHTGIAPAVMNDPELNGYLQSVGSRIITAARKQDTSGDQAQKEAEDNAWMFSKDMRFHFVNSKTLNAFTTGGEHMYIYNELFQKSKNEDELAAVMAHEYAHVYLRHVQSGMNRQYAIIGAAAAAGVAGAVAGGSEHGAEYGAGFGGAALAAGQFVGMGYTRKDEAAADEFGFNFYVHAGWDPKQFGAFFQQMIDLGYDKTPEVASDHPSLKSRVEEANKRAAALPPEAKKWRKAPIADEAKFKALQARAAKLGKSMPDDKSLEGAQTLLAAFPSCFAAVDQPGQAKARKEVQQAATSKSAKKKPQ